MRPPEPGAPYIPQKPTAADRIRETQDRVTAFADGMNRFGFGLMKVGCALTLLAITLPFTILFLMIVWALLTAEAPSG